MRRIVTGFSSYFSGLARAAVRGWNAFFFTPADPTPLGLMRVAVGALAFWSTFVYGLDLADYFGSEGWADPGVLRAVWADRTPYAWSFWTAVPDAWLRPVWAACLLTLALYTVGLFSRVTAVLAWVIVVASARRAPVSLYGFDQALSCLAFYLAATGASGRSVSLDRFLGRWRLVRAETTPARRRRDGRWPLPPGVPTPSIAANLGLRLIQLHLCLMYGVAGLAKLQGPTWWNGLAVWGTLAAGEFRLFDLTWLAAYPLLLNAMTHASLALEIGYPVFVWNRLLRPLVLGCVGLTLGLTEFCLAMIAGNLAFASGPWLRSLVTGPTPGATAGKVLYDGGCPRCRASMAVLTAADPDRLLEPLDLTVVDVAAVHPSLTRAACLEAMHVVDARGRVTRGYDAVAQVGRWLPLFWPLGLVGSLPGVTWAGRRAYNAIAASRPRDVPCSDEVCSIHPVRAAGSPSRADRR